MNVSQDEAIMNFMQITECQDFNQAKNYMTMAEFNLEVYLNTEQQFFLECQPHVNNNTTQLSQSSRQNSSLQKEEFKQQGKVTIKIYIIIIIAIYSSAYSQIQQPNFRNLGSPQRPSQEVIEQYRIFQKEKAEQQGGFLKRVFNMSYNSVTRLFSKQPNYGAEFYETLTQNKITTQIQFGLGNFDENLEKSQKAFKPLIIYVHSNEPNQYVQAFLNNPQLSQFLNKMYQPLGFIQSSQAIQDIKQKGITIDKPFTFYIFRMNLFEKPQLIHQFEISPQIVMEELIAELKRVKAEFNKQYIQDEDVRKFVRENDNPWAQQDMIQEPLQQQQLLQPAPPRQQSQIPSAIQQAQQQKIQEERILRQQQQEALKIAEEENRKKIQKKEDEARKLKEQEENLKKQHEERLFKKAQLMSNLPNEPSDQNPNKIEFLFRMPNGSQKERKFLSSDLIEVLFDFVGCQNDDCFETPDQDFDLIQNFPRLSLMEEKQKKIEEIFQESQMEQLIVKEL